MRAKALIGVVVGTHVSELLYACQIACWMVFGPLVVDRGKYAVQLSRVCATEFLPWGTPPLLLLSGECLLGVHDCSACLLHLERFHSSRGGP